MKFKPQCLIIGFFLVILVIPSIGSGQTGCDNPIWNPNNGYYYTTLQSAHDDAVDGDIIFVQAAIFFENVYFDMPKTVYIEGGYDCDFLVKVGQTIIAGEVYVNDSSSDPRFPGHHLENIIIQSP